MWLRDALRSVVVLLAAASAYAERLPIRTYTTADGLAHNEVHRIVRDSRGFLWFCTRDGLSRFDGYSFSNFGIAQGLPSANVSEGSCPGPDHLACLNLVTGSRNLVIHIDPRQPILIAAGMLAHELYHAAEIARAPEVVDGESLKALYLRIGEQSCRGQVPHCWETRAAQAFQELVTRQLVNGDVKTHNRHEH